MTLFEEKLEKTITSFSLFCYVKNIVINNLLEFFVSDMSKPKNQFRNGHTSF